MLFLNVDVTLVISDFGRKKVIIPYDHRIRVLWAPERQKTPNCQIHSKILEGTILFWWGIIIGAKTPLPPIQKTLNGSRYVHLVLEFVIRLWRGAIWHSFISMQDNASPPRCYIFRVACMLTRFKSHWKVVVPAQEMI